MPRRSTRLPPQDRHHALAAVDARLLEATRIRDGYASRLQALSRVNGSDRRTEVLLRLVEHRLELRRSRDVILQGDDGDAESDWLEPEARTGRGPRRGQNPKRDGV